MPGETLLGFLRDNHIICNPAGKHVTFVEPGVFSIGVRGTDEEAAALVESYHALSERYPVVRILGQTDVSREALVADLDRVCAYWATQVEASLRALAQAGIPIPGPTGRFNANSTAADIGDWGKARALYDDPHEAQDVVDAALEALPACVELRDLAWGALRSLASQPPPRAAADVMGLVARVAGIARTLHGEDTVASPHLHTLLDDALHYARAENHRLWAQAFHPRAVETDVCFEGNALLDELSCGTYGPKRTWAGSSGDGGVCVTGYPRAEGREGDVVLLFLDVANVSARDALFGPESYREQIEQRFATVAEAALGAVTSDPEADPQEADTSAPLP